MTDLGSQLSAYGEQIESARSPVGLEEATRPDTPFVSRPKTPTTDPSWRRSIAAAVVVAAAVALGVWALASVTDSQDPMLPPAATISVPPPTTTIPDEPSTTTSVDDSTDDQEGAVDEATLDMLHSYVETRWSGDLDAAMALVADPDLLSDDEVRFGFRSIRFERYTLADPWYSWLVYTPAEQFPGGVVPNQMAEAGDSADRARDLLHRQRDLLRRTRAAMLGPLIFEVKLGTELISMDCGLQQARGTLIQCSAEATNQFHPADAEPITHIFEFFVVDGRIFMVGSTSYQWVPANRWELDDTVLDAWRSACHVVFEEDTGYFVPSYPDDTVEAWTALATNCSDFTLEHLGVEAP